MNVRRLTLAAALLLGAQFAHANNIFEKGDALYRPKKSIWGLGVFFGHAAIYLNSDSKYVAGLTRAQFASANTLPNINASDGLHSVIQAPGYALGGVQAVPFSKFLSNKNFWGSYETSGLKADQRMQIILAAGRRLQADYTLWWGWKGDPTYLNPAGGKFRCDGLVSYAYAQAGVTIPENPGGWLTNLPRTQRNQLQSMNGGALASGRAPICAPVTVSASAAGYQLSAGPVKDDAYGSGIDRVEFYSGLPGSGSLIGVDDHDSNPDAGASASDVYVTTAAANPGSSVYTMVYDQAGNYAVCSASGSLVSTSNLTQTAPNIVEDVTPPTIGAISIPPGNQTVTASWSATDDQTPSNQINYAYAVDVPFAQWDDPVVTILGAQTSVTIDATAMNPGQHTFYLIALDQEGNIGSASQMFTVSSPPLLSISNLYNNFSGVAPVSPEPSFLVLPGQALTFNASSQAGLSSLSITGPGGAVPWGPGTLTPGASSITGQFTPTSAGQYTATVVDSMGQQTVAPFLGATLSVGLDPGSSSSYDAANGQWSYTAMLDVAASAGAGLTYQLTSDATGAAVLQTQSGAQPGFTAAPAVAPPNLYTDAVDAAGASNTMRGVPL